MIPISKLDSENYRGRPFDIHVYMYVCAVFRDLNSPLLPDSECVRNIISVLSLEIFSWISQKLPN